MYNKAKYLTGKIGAILGLVAGGLLFVVSLIATIDLITIPSSTNSFKLLWTLILVALRWTLSVIFFSRSLSTIHKPFIYTSKEPPASFWIYASVATTVLLIVFSSVFFVFGIITTITCAQSGAILEMVLQILLCITCAGVIVFKALFLSKKGGSPVSDCEVGDNDGICVDKVA